MVDGRRMCKKRDKAGIKNRFIAIRLSTKYCLYLCDIYSILEHHHRIATISRSSRLPPLHFHVITLHNRTNASLRSGWRRKKCSSHFSGCLFLRSMNGIKREAFDVGLVKVLHTGKKSISSNIHAANP